MEYNIKREGNVIVTVIAQGIQTKKIMDVNIVDVKFTLSTFIDFTIGDYIEVFGETYVLQEPAEIKEASSVQFDYIMQFVGQAYQLAKIAMLGLDGEKNLTQSDFSVMGTAEVIIDLVLQNANRLSNGWVKGIIDVTSAANFTFTANDNCLSALSTITNEFDGLEWWVNGKTINMTKLGDVQDVTFKYGQGNGLYDVTRSVVSDKKVCTRLYAYGSTDNLPGDYRGYSNRLKLPSPNIYVESNVDKFGIIERVVIFDDIRPEYIGTISAVKDNFTFSDPDVDFDINQQLLPGQTGQVSFLTGQLAGYNFDIQSFDNSSKIITINTNQDEKAITLPSDLLKPQPGDSYTFISLQMPQSYITDAENRLDARATSYIGQNSVPWVSYAVTCDPINFKARNVVIVLGNYVKIIDDKFGLNQNIRVVSFTRDLQDVYKYTLDLQDNVQLSSAVVSYEAYQKIQTAVSINRLTDVNRARVNWQSVQQLKSLIYDPDQYFDMGNFRPGSIETLILTVGSKAQQFVLNGVIFSANFNGDRSKLNVTAGQLAHFTIYDQPYTWNVAAIIFANLDDGTPYYIYVKCSKNDNSASVVLSPTPILTDAEADYFHFLVGVLHSVMTGVRGISLTYGMTTITGQFITTGRISSTDGLTYFDLNSGVISGKIQFQAGSKGYENLIDKPDLTPYDEAVETSSRVAEITDYLFTTINGSVIAAGTLLVGSGTHNTGGITGSSDQGDNSARLWFGATYENRYGAPFLVTNSGSVTVKSSATGKRIVIDGVNNNFRFYDSAGTIVLNIDSNAAIESLKANDGAPPTIVYGAGIFIGSTDTRYTSIGKLGFQTNGFIVGKDATFGSVTSGAITASGKITVSGGIDFASSSTNEFNITNLKDYSLDTVVYGGKLRVIYKEGAGYLVLKP